VSPASCNGNTRLQPLTSDDDPSHDESWDHEVRAGLINQFTTGLRALDVDALDAERIIEFTIEVTSATLATVPLDGPDREEALEELEEMAAVYLPAASTSRIKKPRSVLGRERGSRSENRTTRSRTGTGACGIAVGNRRDAQPVRSAHGARA